MEKIESLYYKKVMDIHKELMLQEEPNRRLIISMVNEALNIYYAKGDKE